MQARFLRQASSSGGQWRCSWRGEQSCSLLSIPFQHAALSGLAKLDVRNICEQEFNGYIFKIMGGQDKQGFPMKQGVLVPGRVRLLMKPGDSCFRGFGRRNGERRRKSVRGCIVSPDLSVLNLMIVKQGEPPAKSSQTPRTPTFKEHLSGRHNKCYLCLPATANMRSPQS